MKKRFPVLVCLAVLLCAVAAAAPPEKRLISLDDLYKFKAVSDPRVSPEGAWVAYVVEVLDAKKDEAQSDLYMTSWDGARTLRLTYTDAGESDPRFSPDGRFLSFLSDRGGDGEEDQVWIMSRAGGEAEKLTDFKGGVEDHVWSPDGRRLAIVALDPDPNAPAEGKEDEETTVPPIVIDRFQFKQDYVGYLGPRHHHLYLFDLETRKAEPLTSGAFEDLQPSFSPDGKSIAFVSKRGGDPDRHDNWDIFVIEAKPGATPRQLTTFPGADSEPGGEVGTDSRPAWSPDGKSIAYVQSGPPELIWYGSHPLAVIPAAGGTPRLLTPSLDRNVGQPRWSADGKSLLFLLEDDGSIHLARIPAAGGAIERLLAGRRTLTSFDTGPEGKIAVSFSTTDQPEEIYAVKGNETRPLSRRNDEVMAGLRLATTDPISFKSKDGTEVHGFVVRPPDGQAGKKYPALLRIHGGPVSQFGNEFNFDWQLFAAHGYAVIGANPRGSSGRGTDYSKAIWAAWGGVDAQDVLAAVDHAVAQGIADPDRLGIGGWSYGGMLTNYTIAQDTRFKAATSGASISNNLAGYGTDHYVREYQAELGVPWKNLDAYMRVSFPFYQADRIKTPTLFLCGQKDFNVPLLNSEQMYQALRSLGIDTQLIIYPGQYHGIETPSYQRDRLERYLAWYDRYLMPKR